MRIAANMRAMSGPGEGREARVLVAEHDTALREALVSVLRGLPEVGEVIEAPDPVGAVTAAPAADLVLLDMELSDDGAGLTRRLGGAGDGPAIVALGRLNDPDFAQIALDAGALSYL